MERLVVARYEDGEEYACPVSMWRSANVEDEGADMWGENAEILRRMEAGETVRTGGGAQPIVDLRIEERGVA